MYCMPATFLLNGLLLAREPHVPAVLVHVEHGFILHNQNMFLLSWRKCGWDALECLIVIRGHQA